MDKVEQRAFVKTKRFIEKKIDRKMTKYEKQIIKKVVLYVFNEQYYFFTVINAFETSEGEIKISYIEKLKEEVNNG